MNTAVYNGKTIYISYLSLDQTYVLASHYEGISKTFKVNISELTDLDCKIDNLPTFNKEDF